MKPTYTSLLLVCLVLGIGCNQKKIDEAQSDLDELRSKNAKMRSELREQRQKLSEQKRTIGGMNREREILFGYERKLQPVTEYRTRLTRALSFYDKELELWRTAHRNSLAGLKVPYIEKADGTRIPKVEILEVTADTIKISSSGQVKLLNIADLNDGAQKRLVYEKLIK